MTTEPLSLADILRHLEDNRRVLQDAASSEADPLRKKWLEGCAQATEAVALYLDGQTRGAELVRADGGEAHRRFWERMRPMASDSRTLGGRPAL